MKRKPYPYPRILEALVGCGIGRRKARRMIKHAIFVNHKEGTACYDTESLAVFCIWSRQGVYASTWVNKGCTQYARS